MNGDFQVHKAGCRSVKTDLKQSDCTAPLVADYASQEAALRDLWSDIIGDYNLKPEDVDLTWLNECHAGHQLPLLPQGNAGAGRQARQEPKIIYQFFRGVVHPLERAFSFCI